MAATLPRLSRPSLDPPTTALPPLPSPKLRKSIGSVASKRTSPTSNLPTSSLPLRPIASRMSSASTGATQPPPNVRSNSTNTVPSLKTVSGPLTPGDVAGGPSIRRTISVNAFPHPPKSGTRISSLPPSPLTTGLNAGAGGRRDSADANSPITPSTGTKLKRPKTFGSGGSPNTYSGAGTPSLLNGSGDSKSISSGAGARGSDGLLSLPSPAQSRSSSAQDSYSTSATTLDDGEGAPRGREGLDDAEGKRGSKSKEGKGNVIVSVRVRPDVGSEGKADGEWLVDGRRSLVAYRGREGGDYYYDNVFGTNDKNAKVYDSSAKRLVRRVMEGYHGTVFAYGMTGTGKTYSMNGTAASPGVIPLAITDIFSYIRETPHREFLLRVSYLEIYNEKIHDLLSPPSGGGGLGGLGAAQEEIKLREDSRRGVYASPLKEEIVQSPTQLLRVIARGDHARRTGSTQYNTRSSRSHAVVQIVVESRERTPGNGSMTDNKRSAIVPGGVRVSTLSLIDLAGSERAAEDKERRTEGAHINKSLLTLGTVIARLSGDKDKKGNPLDKDGKHLPYRDSKLTRLLQSALSGNSLVSILCTIQLGSVGSIAAASSHTGETLNTLKFAARAKNNIVSHAKKAEEALGSGGDAGARVLLERYRMEILELRGQLEGQAKQKVEEEEKEREKEAEQRHEEQMLEMQLARTALKERIEHLNRLILCSKSTGVNNSGTFSSLGTNARFSGATNGTASALSVRSSTTPSTVGKGDNTHRTASIGSTSTLGQLPNAHSPVSPPGDRISDDDESTGEYGDGTATLTAQIRALQADLADKTRYISTLEKRLLQARRSSHSRMSLGLSPTKVAAALGGDNNEGVGHLLAEKDAEIADLRARLDDKDRMMTALRSAARKRDVADLTTDHSDNKHLDAKDDSPVGNGGPVGLLPPRGRKRNKSVDEMSKMLDEMIQDRVESGQIVKGNRGSVRLAPENKQRLDISLTAPGPPPLKALPPINRGFNSASATTSTS